MSEHATPKAISGFLPAMGRTLALSDLHLGRVTTCAQAPETLRPLVEGFDCVLLLGDIIDHWYTDKEQLKDLEHRLFNVCKSAGVKKVLYFRGNHDAAHEEGEEFAIIGDVLFLHGHAVYNRLPEGNGHKARIKDFNSRHYGEKRIASRQNKAVWKLVDKMYGTIPMAMMMPFAWPWPVVRRIKSLVDEVSPHGNVRGVVLGHSHRPGVKRLTEDVTLFNLGGWIKNTRACAFIQESNHVKLVHVENRSKHLAYGKILFERNLAHPSPMRHGLVSHVMQRLRKRSTKGKKTDA